MKTTLLQSKSTVPSPLQIAVLPENFELPSISETEPPLSRTPFTDFMLHPDKLKAALKIARRENDDFEVSRAVGRNFDNSAASNLSFKNNGVRKSANHLRGELKKTEFHLEAPAGTSVKLAADFTEWEKFPLDMIKTEDGVWSIFIPLLPGNYSYRFIVDGKWCDDPCADLYESNPFGAANAVIKVT